MIEYDNINAQENIKNSLKNFLFEKPVSQRQALSK